MVTVDAQDRSGLGERGLRGADPSLRAGPQMCEYEAIAERIAALPLEGPVLDWGCGFGQVSDLLARRGVAVESFDYRAGAEGATIELECFPGRTAYVSGDPVRLPYEDDRFAAVLSCGVLEHVPEPARSLQELRRVLEPGGRLLVYKLPNRYSYLAALARITGRGRPPRVYDGRRTLRLLQDNGFRVDSFRRANMLPLALSHPLARRCPGAIWRANRALARVPLLNLLATNLEADGTARPRRRLRIRAASAQPPGA